MDRKTFPYGQCRLILIGKTGNGKSSTGNTILGFQTFKPKVGINSGTKEGKLESVNVNGVELQVMDTPGLQDTEETNMEISDRITRSLMSIHPGPHAIVLCLSCDQRFTQEELNVVEVLKNIFGEGMMNHLIVIMTKKDALDNAGAIFEEQLSACTELSSLLTSCSNRYVLFDNRPQLDSTKKREQMEQLMRKVVEVVKANGGQYFRHKLSMDMESCFGIMALAELRQLDKTLEQCLQESTNKPTIAPKPKRTAPPPPEPQQAEFKSTTARPLSLPELSPPPKPAIRANSVTTHDSNPTRQEILVDIQPRQGTAIQPAVQRSVSSGSLSNDAQDPCMMDWKSKRMMFEMALRRKLARGEGLMPEQEAEVRKLKMSIIEKLREGMRKLAIKSVYACAVM